MEPAQWMELAKQGGPILVLVFVLIWWLRGSEQKREDRDNAREERMGARLDAMQDRYETTMNTVVKDNTNAMQATANAVTQLTAVVADLKRSSH